ncbi:MAG: acyl--CoA ligase [Yoonia sp.]|nr:acyl--CoA ligase [Yoonia sp.]
MLSVTTHIAPDAAPDPFNMAAHVLRNVDRLGDKVALSILHSDRSEDWTYSMLGQAVRGTAQGLLDMELHAGDRILLRLGNSADFPVAYLGCIAAGLIPVPLSTQLTTREVQQIAANIRPAATIQSDTIDVGTDRVITPEVLRSFYSLPPAPFAMGDPNRPAYIIHTSGTSGQPRAVVHAHRAVWARQLMWDGWYGLRSDDRMLHAGAFNWTYTLGTGLMDPWAIGATALIPADGTDAAALPALMAHYNATIFAAAPGVYRRLLRKDMPAMPALRHGLSAGEKLPDDTRHAWEAKTGTAVHEAFGMSECSTFVSGSPSNPAPPHASGFGQDGRHVAIIDNGQPVPRGVVGTIAVHKGDAGLMLGYLDAPADTAAKFDGDWFMTGDMGVMDHDGAISYAGRRDDMMNAGGYRVSPIEVEAVLCTHPHITEAAACAVCVKKDVRVIAAFYTSAHMIDVDQLAAWCVDRLAGYKCPRLFIACDALPRGANNKLLRRVLRQNWETENGQT